MGLQIKNTHMTFKTISQIKKIMWAQMSNGTLVFTMFSKTITGFPVANRTWNTSGFQNNH
jgi:hypothetical protein